MSGHWNAGLLTPWAEQALKSEERVIVKRHKISVSGKSARGPWVATSALGRFEDARIRVAINAAAGEELV